MPLADSRFVPVAGLLVFFWASAAFGGIAVDNTSNTNALAPAGNQIAWPHTVLSGSSRILVVGVSLRRSTNTEFVTGVNYGSQGLTFIGAAVSTDLNQKYRAELWYLLAPPSGTNTITVQFSGAVNSTVGGAVSFTGVNQTTPIGSFAGAGGGIGTPSVSVSSAVGEVVIDTIAIKGNNNNAITPGSGQTQRWNDQTGNNLNTHTIGGGSTKPGAASVTMSWSVVSEQQWSMVAVPLKPMPDSANLTLDKNADRATVAPGQDITYTVKASNGAGLTPASVVVVSDPIPAWTGFKVGSATFAPETSTLSGTAVYSSDNGATWAYGPVSGGCAAPAGYDFCVTNVRWTTTGTMPQGTSFSVTFVVRVK